MQDSLKTSKPYNNFLFSRNLGAVNKILRNVSCRPFLRLSNWTWRGKEDFRC